MSRTVSLRTTLATQGYAYLPAFSLSPDTTGLPLLALARTLGPLYVPADVDRTHPILETHPAPNASPLAPFDRAEAIGWHNDFSTHPERPRVSLAYLAQPDPRGPTHGAWRVASVDRVLDHLAASSRGRDVLRYLLDTDLPYSFTGDGVPVYFRPIELRDPPPGRLGLRFYGRAIRDGARLVHRAVPPDIEHAIRTVETAADHVGVVLAAPAGALLVTDNWHSLHDRLAQSVDLGLPLRRSLLCFLEALWPGPAPGASE